MFSPLGSKDVRVLLLDPLPVAATGFDDARYEVDEYFGDHTEADLVKRITEYNVVCLSRERDSEYLTDEVLRSGHRLLAIGVFGTLSNQVNLQAAAQMGIPVFTAPYQHQHSAAELIISNIVILARQIGDRSREIHRGEWNKTSSNCVEVRGKTLGIVGYGHVGSQLGVMAEALSLRVLFYDAVSLMPIGRAQPTDSLDELLAQSDYVSLNISASPENVNLFNKDVIAKMKKGSCLINVSAGDAVDQQALADAIKSGHLAGAAIDIHPPGSVSSKTFTSPLQNVPNVILTPSIAGDTVDARRRIIAEVTTHVVRYIRDGTTTGAVNFPSVAAWPLKPGMRRIICMHRNIRGLLREIDHVLSAYNVGKQVLDTKDTLGYLIADVATEQVTTEIVSQLAMLANTIRTRIV
ncbi:D-isomer specific 2-hydroxyacid dehydrogenase [Entophlyctis helioformis]|nr:D-isomer specific 2-hydroxyacid dehydrogenase [Entophlyctis helioformis]